jgi:hypothetical protein
MSVAETLALGKPAHPPRRMPCCTVAPHRQKAAALSAAADHR